MDYLPSDFFLGFSWESVLSLVITIILLLMSAFMSSSEVAFFSLSPADIKRLDHKNKRDAAVLSLISNPQKLLATILTGNNFVNIAIVILSAYTVNSLFDFGDHRILSFIFQTVIITFLLLLFGEILPKISATLLGVKLARYNAPSIAVLQKILSPISWMLIKSTGIIDRKAKEHKHTNISIDELETALKITSKDKEKSDTDNALLEGIVNFGNIAVSQVMTSRIDMTSIDITMSFKQVLQTVRENGYSRLPVLSDTDDDIRGILYVKDLLPYLDKSDSFRWQSLIRNAFFVPETKMIDDLLTDFQKNKIHIAIVVDEFGGTSGVVTMKDILEEIMGDISDEYDDVATPLFKQISKGVFRIEARIPVNDLFKIDGVNEDDFSDLADDVETLAGLILEIKGEIPKEKERIAFKQYTFEIEKADDRHIERVVMTVDGNGKNNTDNK